MPSFTPASSPGSGLFSPDTYNRHRVKYGDHVKLNGRTVYGQLLFDQSANFAASIVVSGSYALTPTLVLGSFTASA